MTIRFLALLTICIAIALASVPTATTSVLTNTGRELDIAITGRGYLQLSDPASTQVRYSRSGHLHLTADSQLATTLHGQEWLIEPRISFPPDTERIGILTDGNVQCLLRGEWLSVGRLQLAMFPRVPTFETPHGANRATPNHGVPTVTYPGEIAGTTQQGWLESRPAFRSALALRVLLALIAASLLTMATRDVLARTRPGLAEPTITET